MTEPSSSWPPPPQTAYLPVEHDEFLAVCVHDSPLKPPLSRTDLAKSLHQETGKDTNSCMAVVNDFCDRHTIFMPAPGMWPRLRTLLAVLGCFDMLTILGFQFLMAFKVGAALIHFLCRAYHLDINILLPILVVMFVVCGLLGMIGPNEAKKEKADAAEAAKFGGAG